MCRFRVDVGIDAVGRRGFAEVRLDAGDAHLEQRAQSILEPVHRGRVRVVDDPDVRSVAAGQHERATATTADQHIGVARFGEGWRVDADVGPLPEGHREAQVTQLRDHRGGIGEARSEAPVADPVVLEPAGVDMHHVGRDVAFARLSRHLEHLVL